MTQTTGQISKAKYIIETSEDGSAWTDISGSANFVDSGTQERLHGHIQVGQGDTALTTTGNREPITATFRFAYTEAAGESHEIIRDLFETNQACYVRVTPSAGGAGKKRLTSALGHFVTFKYPENDSSAGDPKLSEASFFHAGWTTATI